MPRPPHAIGTYGEIATKKQKNGSWRASLRYRDDDGVTRPVSVFAATEAKAKAKLKLACQERSRIAGATITRETTLSELADLYLAELKFEENVTQQTIDDYRAEIEVSTDKRAGKNTIKIKRNLGNVRIREASTSRLDRHIKEIANAGHREKARTHKVILKGMMGLAVRHGACATNPVRDVSNVKRKRAKPRAADLETLNALREQLRAWQRGDAIKGTPAYSSGPKRSRMVLDIAEMMMATGARPGEVLAIRWCDIDLGSSPARLTITGTIVRVSDDQVEDDTGARKGRTRLMRQEWPKTDAGRRTLVLPRFAVDVLLRLQVDAVPNEHDVVFANRTCGLVEPHNFNRAWRSARGSLFDWVTAKTFRKTVVTMIADELGVEAAASQAGHVDDAVTRRNYWDKPSEVADFTEILDRMGR